MKTKTTSRKIVLKGTQGLLREAGNQVGTDVWGRRDISRGMPLSSAKEKEKVIPSHDLDEEWGGQELITEGSY